MAIETIGKFIYCIVMAVQVSKDLPVTLQDLIAYDGFSLSPPNSLLGAKALANATTGTFPFRNRYDGRYVGSGPGNDLLQYRGYGGGALDKLSYIFGSHLTSFNIQTWTPAFSGIVSRQFTKVDQGDGTNWFNMPNSINGTGQIQRTITMNTNNTGTARNGGFHMRISDSGGNVWQSITAFFNQPSL